MSLLIFAAAAVAAPTSAPVPAPAIAQSAPAKPVNAAALASAKKLLGLMHLDETIDRMMSQLIPVMTTAVLGMLEHNEASQSVVQKIETQPNGRERMMAIFAEEMQKSFRARYPDIIEGAAQEYATVLTEQELDQAIAFYSSGTGAKFLALSPQLQQSVGLRASQIGRAAGVEAGERGMRRAIQAMLPSEKTVS